MDGCYKKLTAAGSTRQQRALILELLDGLRGVAVSEKGKFPRANFARQKNQGKKEQQYSKRQETPDLGDVTDMFA